MKLLPKIQKKNNEENKNSNEKEIINKNIVESIKLLASTLSVEGLKQIQKEILNLLEMKNKN